MSLTEIVRVVLAVGLVVFLVVWRSGLRQWMTEDKEKRKKEEEEKRKADRREAVRKKARSQKQAQARRTSQILKMNIQDLEQKTVDVAGSELWYLEGGGTSPTVLLLHGFASQKEDWNEFAKPLLERQFHVVAPDLPGFGQNVKNPDLNYEVTAQAKRIRAFTKELGLEQFHLVGSSLGGSVAAAYTYGAADQVLSLTLVEPFGVRVPYESDLDQYLARDVNPLILADPVGYDNMLGFLFEDPPTLPDVVKQHRAREAADNRDFYVKMWGQIRGGERAHLLDLLLPEIRRKTLAIQGEKSKVVHPATCQVVKSMVRFSNAVVIPGCGHFPAIEKPAETAAHFLKFLEEVPVAGTEPA